MDRRDRDRYDRDNYNRDYSGGTGYGRDDEHYHSARNLTNEFEQHYRSHHHDWDNDRDRDRFRPHRSNRDEDRRDPYSQRRHEEDRDFRGRDYGYQQRDRYGSQEQRGGRSQDRMREGYGISDYGRMGQSSVHSNRGIPNAGITSSFSDDYGATDFERDRSHGISSGSYGGYGSYSGGFGRSRNDW